VDSLQVDVAASHASPVQHGFESLQGSSTFEHSTADGSDALQVDVAESHASPAQHGLESLQVSSTFEHSTDEGEGPPSSVAL
jgi:hypothetical protein